MAALTRANQLTAWVLGIGVAFVSVAPSAHQVAQPAVAPTATASAAVCAYTWVGHEEAIEQYMLDAPVQKLEAVPIGVTKPQRAVFEPGGLVRRAAWKPLAPSYRGGFRESYKAEIAAYKLDRLLDLRMVPPVIERKISRVTGAMVLWIENTHPWDVKQPPVSPDPEWSHRVSRMRLFDQLVANTDRNAGNLLYDDDWHLFLIDHSRAFTERKDLKGLAVPARIDRKFWNRIDALTAEELETALSGWLSKGELAAMLARREKMREQVKSMVATRGESAVFF